MRSLSLTSSVTLKPASSSFRFASAHCMLRTFGTVTWSSMEVADEVTVAADPVSCDVVHAVSNMATITTAAASNLMRQHYAYPSSST